MTWYFMVFCMRAHTHARTHARARTMSITVTYKILIVHFLWLYQFHCCQFLCSWENTLINSPLPLSIKTRSRVLVESCDALCGSASLQSTGSRRHLALRIASVEVSCRMLVKSHRDTVVESKMQEKCHEGEVS